MVVDIPINCCVRLLHLVPVLLLQLDVVHRFRKHDSRSRNQLHILSTVQSLRSNILMLRRGVTVFLFLLLVVVNRTVLSTV